MTEPTLRRTVIRYYGWITVYFVLIHSVVWYALSLKDRHPNSAGSPLQKAAYYRQNADRFDMLFLGDSRTYCGLHPDQIDPLLGTRSLNLSVFAHWLPTQYPACQDLVADIPAGTTVLWSLGVGEFHPAGNGRIHNTYPVGLANIPQYLSWGYSWWEIEPNFVYFATNDWPGRVLQKLRTIFQRPCYQRDGVGDDSFASSGSRSREFDLAISSYKSNPDVASVEVIHDPDSGTVTSLVALTRSGAYCRLELNREFFRERQQTDALKLRQQAARGDIPVAIVPDPEYFSTFRAMLELFRRHDIQLVVNEIPEAPYVYANSPRMRSYRAFLRREIRDEVERSGFVWISPDVRELEDDDFFDFNHLNSQGIVKYARLLTTAFRRQVPSRATPESKKQN